MALTSFALVMDQPSLLLLESFVLLQGIVATADVLIAALRLMQLLVLQETRCDIKLSYNGV